MKSRPTRGFFAAVVVLAGSAGAYRLHVSRSIDEATELDLRAIACAAEARQLDEYRTLVAGRHAEAGETDLEAPPGHDLVRRVIETLDRPGVARVVYEALPGRSTVVEGPGPVPAEWRRTTYARRGVRVSFRTTYEVLLEALRDLEGLGPGVLVRVLDVVRESDDWREARVEVEEVSR